MASRKVKDAKDLTTGELIYFKGHAQATFTSKGTSVEEEYVSKEQGKGLSTNDFSDEDKLRVLSVDFKQDKPVIVELSTNEVDMAHPNYIYILNFTNKNLVVKNFETPTELIARYYFHFTGANTVIMPTNTI